ncbi:prepilin-type N-terminal cleavage/methylation domain-containing protein [Rossellomorea aquimaris]|uniref:prepilin-type N-terminal cleavage/methylation domain-containing protein n=1 Tax=Rossellomorea aquimaris TaxID=189382 RepID=UPI001CD59428|nr:prepilin-type N-terminal cleavage/methylation domain-containing protein [Rossellomorea aquimaris]MCA1054808.1 prepilin-type N-terminal cleavage/methylation domain-containing protein [Rossellomorea aquimaris]
MFKNSDGFSLIESLVAFSCFMVMLAFFFPLSIRMITTLEAKQQRVEAMKFLQEGIEHAVVTGDYKNSTRMYKGDLYTLSWKESDHSIACVMFKTKGGTNEICVSE